MSVQVAVFDGGFEAEVGKIEVAGGCGGLRGDFGRGGDGDGEWWCGRGESER